MRNVSVKRAKIKNEARRIVCKLFSTSIYLLPKKQLMPDFLSIPAQYCLCFKISLRHCVSNLDSGLVVHAEEAAINL